MKLKLLITINAIVLMGGGIAFALYAPLMMAIFAIPDVLGVNPMAYWNVAAFARMFGAGIFAAGILLFALRDITTEPNVTLETRRGILYALLLGHAMASIVSLTQQYSMWQSWSGWLLTSVFAVFVLAYAYFLFWAPEEKAMEVEVNSADTPEAVEPQQVEK
jgi:Ca2+/Na+ antiporter